MCDIKVLMAETMSIPCPFDIAFSAGSGTQWWHPFSEYYKTVAALVSAGF